MVTISASMHRSIKIIRGETVRIRLHLKPTPVFDAATEEQKRDALQAARSVTPEAFHTMQGSGTVSLSDAYLREYFTVEYEEASDWTYDGGEITIVDQRYNGIYGIYG